MNKAASKNMCPPGATPYIIKAGDTIWKIAKGDARIMALIMQYNPDIYPYNLQIGQMICVPQ